MTEKNDLPAAEIDHKQSSPEYRVMNAISRSYMLEQINGPARLELTRNSDTLKANPLLAEIGLYDVVTLQDNQIITLRKATHAEIRSFLPKAIFKEADIPRFFEINSYIKAKNEHDYLPPVLRPSVPPGPISGQTK